MLIRTENSEYIARDIGERYSGIPLYEKIKKMGVPENVVIYPNTKWRMVFDVMNYYSSYQDEAKALRILSKIIELAVHPLNFTANNMSLSDKLIADFNKRLAFDKLCIKEIDGDFRLVKLSKEPEKRTSTDYITEAINYFKDEYNKVRFGGLSYEYELGTNIQSLLFMYDADDVYKNIDETKGKTKAIEQLAKIGFIKEYTIEERSKDDDPVTYDYAVCTIDESKLTQKEEPVATDVNVQKIVHEHTHRFENSIQEKAIDLNHKYEKINPEPFYITKKDDDFKYKGKVLNLSRNNDYYKTFTALYSKLPEGGEIKYKEFIAELKSRIPEIKSKSDEEMRKFIQTNLTDKSNGFMRYAQIPKTEDNGKPLIEIMRASGVRFNNKTG